MSLSRRHLLPTLALLGLGLSLGCAPTCSCEAPLPEPEPVTVFVIRHAEKETVPDDADPALREDPPLSPAGQLRALALTEDLPIDQLDAVYVTKTRRSRDTASAVLAVTGIEPIVYPPKDVEGLVRRLRERRGQHVLVVGHSNTIPALLTGLGVSQTLSIAEDQYGDMWVVEVHADGRATLEVRRFGESMSHRFGPQR